jgi:hypothetical protein
MRRSKPLLNISMKHGQTEAAFANALTELLRSTGEDAALGLLDKLREQIIAGEFLPNRILQ